MTETPTSTSAGTSPGTPGDPAPPARAARARAQPRAQPRNQPRTGRGRFGPTPALLARATAERAAKIAEIARLPPRARRRVEKAAELRQLTARLLRLELAGARQKPLPPAPPSARRTAPDLFTDL